MAIDQSRIKRAWYVPADQFARIRRRETKFDLTLRHHINFYLEHRIGDAVAGRFGPNDSQLWFHTQQSMYSYSYWSDYQYATPGVFTFDGVKFYKIGGFDFTEAGQASLTLVPLEGNIYTTPGLAFMLMPFEDPDLDALHAQVKDRLSGQFQMKLVRADEIHDNDVIVDTILDHIERAELIVAEITKPNRNVFFEFGYAHARQKEIITLRQQSEERTGFFDRDHIRRIEYSPYDLPAMLDRFGETVRTVRGRVPA